MQDNTGLLGYIYHVLILPTSKYGDQTKGDQSLMPMHETKPQSIKYFLGSCWLYALRVT